MTAELTFGRMWLTNFKTFAGTHMFEFDAEAGLYFVAGINKDDPQLGANGAGKSTLLADSLMWVLFDKTIRDSRPADAVTPWDAGKVKTDVAVEINRSGVQYLVRRTRRPSGLFLAEGDERERTVDQGELERTFGLNEDMFKRTIVLGQFGSMFLDLKPEAQSQMFTDALGLDVWLRAADVAQKDVRTRERAADSARQALEAARTRLGDVKEDLSRAEGARDAWGGQHDAAVASAKGDVTAIEGELKALKKDPPPDPGKGKKSGPSADTLKDQVDADKRALRAATTASAEALASFRTAERLLKDAKAARDRYKDASYDKKCPECGQTVSAKHLRDKLAELEVGVRDALDAFDRAKSKDDELNTAANDADAKVTSSEDALREAEAAGSARREWNTKVTAKQGELERADDRLSDLEKEKNPHTQTVATLTQRHEDSKRALEDAEGKAGDEEQSLEAANFWVASFRDIRLKRLEDALRELEMTTTRYSEALGLEGWQIAFTTERETKSGSTTIGFNVFLYPPGQKEPVRWANYCGGEVQRWQLAVSFALSEILLSRAGLSPNIEVYDEPTRGLSPQGVSRLIEELRERALEQRKAIYLVDHHALDTGLFDGTLKVTRKDGASSFTWQ